MSPNTNTGTNTDTNTKPKPKYTTEQPSGAYLLPHKISQGARADALSFFGNGHVDGFSWAQREWAKRFPNVHHNYFSTCPKSGVSTTDLLKAEYPALWNVAQEAHAAAVRFASETEGVSEKVPGLAAFEPARVSVHMHKPGWGLGAHYDDPAPDGLGTVIMVSFMVDEIPITGEEKNKKLRRPHSAKARQFRFASPHTEKEWIVETHDSSIVMFGGDAYDLWTHESKRVKGQTGTCISITIRSKEIPIPTTNENRAKAAKRKAEQRIQERSVAPRVFGIGPFPL